LLRKWVVYIIKIYQRWISPLKIVPSCRFYPTCSQYAIGAVSKYGIIRGGFMALRRILRCHPFHPGGYDPVK
jgi:putative membrane protein insertion efficiency factor